MRIAIFILGIVLSSCVKRTCPTNGEEIMGYSTYMDFCDYEKIDSLKHEIFMGNVSAYNELRDIYMVSGKSTEFLGYALIMANKGVDEAYGDVSFCLEFQRVIEKKSSGKDSIISYLPIYFSRFEMEAGDVKEIE